MNAFNGNWHSFFKALLQLDKKNIINAIVGFLIKEWCSSIKDGTIRTPRNLRAIVCPKILYKFV